MLVVIVGSNYNTFLVVRMVIISTSSGDRTITVFSGIIEDVVKDVEGASRTEKYLGAPTQKFHVMPKDIVYN